MRWLLLIVAALAARAYGLHLPVQLGAVTAFWYGNALLGQYSATAARRIDWVTDTIKTALCNSTYAPNQDTHTFFSDVTNELATAGGYTAGGVALGTKSVSYDSTTNETRLIAANAAWTTATFTARFAVTYSDTAGASTTDPLMGYVNFGADQSVSSGTFTIQWDATGVLKITAS
jgi:hypothetical protein